MAKALHRGSCLCGGVIYTVKDPLRPVVACHCIQCRKTSGHYVAATACDTADLDIVGSSLTWYRSSSNARRGFCKTCGSSLFWQEGDGSMTSIHAGTLDGETGLVMDSQLLTEFKGDYYDLPDVPIRKQASATD